MASALKSVYSNWPLITQMSRREILGRYKGSVMGVAWSFFNPILLLLVYTFVFSVIFKTRWVDGTGGQAEFAAMLFSGLIVANFFGEVVGRAPALIVSNVNYVKKVVFPLEILTFINIAAALFHAMISICVLLVALVFLNSGLHWTIVLFPLVLIPLVILLCGVSWLLSSLGVYLRDIGQFMGIVVTVMTFLAPVFYPLAAVPEKYQVFIKMNPLTYVVEAFRQVVVRGEAFDIFGWLVYLGISLLIAWVGFVFFQKTRKGFADVI